MGKSQSSNRCNKLVNSQSFCTNHAGEEYSIEEAYDSGEDTGDGKKQRSGDK